MAATEHKFLSLNRWTAFSYSVVINCVHLPGCRHMCVNCGYLHQLYWRHSIAHLHVGGYDFDELMC